ncbi:hypothetical protein GYMLUDRAFT_255804 [Collybiopsis luxurians FD-317 M1]|nr:hypothetical protein GYMLUDRAFT_255804 [Collybiopsis luxurians FD-317 M1]
MLTQFSHPSNEILELQTRLKVEERREMQIKTELERIQFQYNSQRNVVLIVRNSLTAIHRLPSEILSEIFQAYTEANHDEPLTQLHLMHICRAWCNTALKHSPRIWTRLYISFTNKPTLSSEHWSMMMDWLKCSSLPLELHIESSKSKNLGQEHLPEELIKAIIPFCSRVRALQLQGTQNSFMPLFSLPANSLPILSDLELDICVEPGARCPRILTFSNSPLQKLSFHTRPCFLEAQYQLLDITSDPKFIGLGSFELNSAQLSLLECDALHTHGIYSWNFLRNCAHLVQCTIDLHLGHVEELDQVTLPALTTLTIKTNLYCLPMLSLLNTLSLESLCLDFKSQFYSCTNLSQPLIDFQRRSDCTVTHLSFIEPSQLMNRDLLSLIDAFDQSLHSLSLINARKISPKTLLKKLQTK